MPRLEQVILVSSADVEAGGKLYGLTNDETLTIDGTDYRVHDIRPIDDGAFREIVVAEA